MFQKKPQAPRPDQKARLSKALEQLKLRLDGINGQLPNASEITSDPFSSGFREAFRKSVLDTRAAYENVMTSLRIVQACIQDATDIWPEGSRPLSLLVEAGKLTMRLVGNLIEENLALGSRQSSGRLFQWSSSADIC